MVKNLINHKRPVINGDGNYSRDFTYIDNVFQANEKALFTTDEQILKGQKEYYNLDLDEHKYLLKQAPIQSFNMPAVASAKEGHAIIQSNSYFFSEVFNIAFGGSTILIRLFDALRDNLSRFDKKN